MVPRLLPQIELERYCELIAAIKLRTPNKAGRHLCTVRAIELMGEYGVELILVKVFHTRASTVLPYET